MLVKRQRNKQSGMAMVLVITILAALLGIASVGLSLQLDSTKSTTLVKETRASLYCAEAGLAAARDTIVANRSTWKDVLDGDASTVPAWYSTSAPEGITGDADGNGVSEDYSVTIADDGDDAFPLVDSNDTIVVTSKCLLYPKAPVSVKELISLSGVGNLYRNQSGQGAGNTGNAN